MNQITELTYLNVNNPWRWNGIIKDILNRASKEKTVKILNETGTAYLRAFNITDKDLLWYFEDKINQEIISSGSVDREHGKGMMSLIGWMVDGRKETHKQYIEDVKKIYSLVINKAIEKNIDISKYPKSLEELTN